MTTPPSQWHHRITCHCGRRVHVRLGDFRSRRTVRCPAGHRIQLQEARPGEVAKADRAMRDLDRQLRHLKQTARRLGR